MSSAHTCPFFLQKFVINKSEISFKLTEIQDNYVRELICQLIHNCDNDLIRYSCDHHFVRILIKMTK